MRSSEQTRVRVASGLLHIAMVITMGIGLVLVFKEASRASECPGKRIATAAQSGTKTFYTFTDGTSVWSENGFTAGELVCLR